MPPEPILLQRLTGQVVQVVDASLVAPAHEVT